MLGASLISLRDLLIIRTCLVSIDADKPCLVWDSNTLYSVLNHSVIGQLDKTNCFPLEMSWLKCLLCWMSSNGRFKSITRTIIMPACFICSKTRPEALRFYIKCVSLQAKRRLELDELDHQYSEPARPSRGRRAALKVKSPKGILTDASWAWCETRCKAV